MTYYYDFKNVANISYLLKGCVNLQYVHINRDSTFYTKLYYACDSVIYNCTNLEYSNVCIPSSFNAMLGTGTPNVQYFYGNCANLTAKLIDLIPYYGFTSRVVDVNGMFKGCSKITATESELATVADLLWNDTTKIWKNTSTAFTGCSDDIRAMIPKSWGGTKEE